jgi:hypothetical protein
MEGLRTNEVYKALESIAEQESRIYHSNTISYLLSKGLIDAIATDKYATIIKDIQRLPALEDVLENVRDSFKSHKSDAKRIRLLLGKGFIGKIYQAAHSYDELISKKHELGRLEKTLQQEEKTARQLTREIKGLSYLDEHDYNAVSIQSFVKAGSHYIRPTAKALGILPVMKDKLEEFGNQSYSEFEKYLELQMRKKKNQENEQSHASESTEISGLELMSIPIDS